MTVLKPHPHINRRAETLICACCGAYTLGRQWFNQDKGYGLCPKCITLCSRGQTDQEVQSTYGVRGVHYDLDYRPDESYVHVTVPQTPADTSLESLWPANLKFIAFQLE